MIARLFNDCIFVQKRPLILSFPENLLINVSDGRSLNAELWHFPEDIIINLWEEKRQLFRPHSSFFLWPCSSVANVYIEFNLITSVISTS